MKGEQRIGVLAGAFVGFIVSLLMRPSIPFVGQPPIGASLGALLNSRSPIDREYASEFMPIILLCIVGGMVVGLLFDKIVSSQQANNRDNFTPNNVANAPEHGGSVGLSPEPIATPTPQPYAESPAPPTAAPRAVPVEGTEAIAPSPPPKPAPQAYQPIQPERPRQVARSSAPKQASAAVVQGKIRNSVYRQDADGSCTIIKGKYVGRTFRTFEEMRRTLR